MSYKTKVEEIAGSVTGITGYTADTTMNGWLVATIREIIGIMPSILKLSMTKAYTDSGSGVTLGLDGGGDVLYAHKSYYRAQRGIPADKARYASGSIYAPTKYSPIYYVERNKGYMLPDGGTFEVFYMPVIVYSDDFGSYADGDTVIPESVEHLIVLGTAVKVKNLQVYSKRLEYNAKILEIVVDRPVIDIDDASSSLEVANFAPPEPLAMPHDPLLDFAHIESMMAEEDTELISSRGEIMGKRIDEFNTKLKGNLDKFDADIRLELERFNSDIKLSTEKASNALQVYPLELDAEVKKVDLNTKSNQDVVSYATQLLEEYRLLTEELAYLTKWYAQDVRAMLSEAGPSPAVPKA